MKKSFFAFCIAVVLIAIAPLTAGALEVVVTNKYSPKDMPRGGCPFVLVYGNNNVQGKNVVIMPGKTSTVLKSSRATKISRMLVSVGTSTYDFRFSIKGSKIIFHIAKRNGKMALYAPQLKKYYYPV